MISYPSLSNITQQQLPLHPNMAFPPDFGRPAVKAKPREIDLANLSYSRKEN